MEPKMAFAGVMLKTSFVRFMTWMAIFNEESVPSRPFCRLDSWFRVMLRRENGVVCWLRRRIRAVMEIRDRHVMSRLVQTKPFDVGNCIRCQSDSR